MWQFNVLIGAHIVTGTLGAASFWIPVLSQKGGRNHRRWGRVFFVAMLVTACLAICMSLMSLRWPLETHPLMQDLPLIRGVFGWMMLYLGILTINLAWYSWLCVRNVRNHRGNLEWRNQGLQWILLLASLNCAWQGWKIDQTLMMAFSVVGFATVATNLRFMYKASPRKHDWALEHIKGGIGAGISVYTAFFAFGSVRLIPELALHPGLWSIPLATGLALILYHQASVSRAARQR